MQNGPRQSLALRGIDHQLARRGRKNKRINASILVAHVESEAAAQRVILGTTINHVVTVFSEQLVISPRQKKAELPA